MVNQTINLPHGEFPSVEADIAALESSWSPADSRVRGPHGRCSWEMMNFPGKMVSEWWFHGITIGQP